MAVYPGGETPPPTWSSSPSDASWINTPPGIPPQLDPQTPSHATYYYAPDITSFNFTDRVAEFLQNRTIGPRGLCMIDATRNYEFMSWRGRFSDAGLTADESEELEQLLLDELSAEQRLALDIGSAGSPRIPAASATSIGSESSLGDDE